MKPVGFYPGKILLPQSNLAQWSVVACDQFTSQPEYWKEVEQIAGNAPSAFRIIFPEAELEKVDFNEKIAAINQTMKEYLEQGVFQEIPEAMIYVERTLLNGSVRKGVLGLLDLEEYDYHKGSASLVRATEGTVLERIPPRVRIRENAPLESPHILILVDDPEKTVVEPLSEKTSEMKPLYDFELMQGGGQIRGWLLNKEEKQQLVKALADLSDPQVFAEKYGILDAPLLVYAVGDGNHSLAAAKACWENLKKSLTPEEIACHPARYALAELGNLHDDSLKFEAIHRVVFGADEANLLSELQKYAESRSGDGAAQTVTIVSSSGEKTLLIPHPDRTLAVGSIQAFLDEYLSDHPGKVDYIHGADVVRSLVRQGAVGILLPVMEKEELFRTVILEGALPRKTFSMGEASEKRYYLECRKIK